VRLSLTIQYLGTAYAGWQAQDNALAIQTVIERVLARLYTCDIPVVRLHGAARTDTGVHARMQVAHFDPPFSIPTEGLLRGVNDALPDDIRVIEVRPVPKTFHALASSLEKEYRYRLWIGDVRPPFLARTTAEGPRDLDLDRLSEAARLLPGRRDFALFRKTGSTVKTTVRDLREVRIETVSGGNGTLVTFVIRADGFLRGTVRLLVGTLLDAGRGRLAVEVPLALLEGDAGAGRIGTAAPASGLFLWKIDYREPGPPPPPTPPGLW